MNRQFATGNSTFDGGLFVHGKSSTGKEFSFALDDQTTAGITLDFGTWDIRVIGWDNAAETFEGDVLCASKQITFSQDNQLETLKVTNEACNQNTFSGTAYRTTTLPYSFNELEVSTCGALYDPASPVVLRTPASLASLYCDEYPKALQRKAKGLIISLDTLRPDGSRTVGLSSNCIPAENTPTAEILTLKRIPTKIPVTIQLYATEDCSEGDLTGTFRFPDGIETTVSRGGLSFDHILHPTTYMLALPVTSSLRATNFLGTETPLLRCDNNSKGCGGLGATSGYDYIMDPTTSSYVRLHKKVDCDTMIISAPDTAVVEDCWSRDAETFLLITPDLALNEGDTSSFDVDGENYTYIIGNGYLGSLREMAAIIGLDDASDARDSFGEASPDIDEDLGLSEVELFLSSSGISGLFWDQRCSTTPLASPVSRTLIRNEDGEQKTYQVTYRNSPSGLTMPAYLAVAADPQHPTPEAVLNRRFVIREIMPPTQPQTRVIIDIACDNTELVNLTGTSNIRIGRFERQQDNTEDGVQGLEQNLIMWNTSDQENARYEQFRRNYETVAGSGLVLRDNTRYIRTQKLPDGGSNHSLLKALSLQYLYERNIGDPNDAGDDTDFETFNNEEYAVAPHLVTKTLGGALTPNNGGYRGTFTQPVFLEEMSELRFQKFISGRNLVSAADGRYVHVYYVSGGSIQMKYFNGSSYEVFDDTPIWPEEFWVGLSPNGNRAIVVVRANNVIHTYFFESGAWTKSPNDLTTGNGIDQVRGEIDDSGNYLIGLYENGIFSYAGGTTGTPATTIDAFNQYTDVNDFIYNYSIIQTTEGFFFALNRGWTDGTNFERTIATCKMVVANSDCENLQEHYESTDGLLEIVKLSVEPAANGTDFIVHAVVQVDATNRDAIRVEVDGASGIGVPSTTALNLNFFSDSVFHFGNVGQDMTTGATGTSDITINVPYISGGSGAFPLTFGALDPQTFAGRFTPPASFEGTN